MTNFCETINEFKKEDFSFSYTTNHARNLQQYVFNIIVLLAFSLLVVIKY